MKQSFDMAFIKKHLEKPSSKTFLGGSRRKASFIQSSRTSLQVQLYKYNCSGHSANVKDRE